MRDLGIEYDWRDTVKEPLSRAEFEKLLGRRPVEEFLNPKSTPFRERGLAGRKISKSEAIGLMMEDVNFLKRPILVRGARYVFGFDEDAIRQL
ncbi:MAG: hypothetical protein KC591_12105 [Gemmatimonadetes bacterium]|nr:hypothetical protein [Gemmatimonadota bacterium]